MLGQGGRSQSKDTSISCCWNSIGCHYPTCSQHIVAGSCSRSCSGGYSLESSVKHTGIEGPHEGVALLRGPERGACSCELIFGLILDHKFGNAFLLCFELIDIIFLNEALALEHPCCLTTYLFTSSLLLFFSS
jgi:hypothetical protein